MHKTKLRGDRTAAPGDNMMSVTPDRNLELVLSKYMKEPRDCPKMGSEGLSNIP